MTAQSVQAVERAIEVLDVIRDSGGEAGVSEISRELDLAKSTVHRLLCALMKGGLVKKNEETNAYSLGHKILELAFEATTEWELMSIAMPYLEELRDMVEETTALAYRFGWKYTYVAQAVSLSEYCFTPHLGQQYPLHWAATGKTILAHLPSGEIDEYLRFVPLKPATDHTITESNALLSELNKIQTVDYAVSFGERRPGASAVAAPLLNHEDRPYGAVAVIGPESRLQGRNIEALGLAVTKAAQRISIAARPIAVKISAPYR